MKCFKKFRRDLALKALTVAVLLGAFTVFMGGLACAEEKSVTEQVLERPAGDPPDHTGAARRPAETSRGRENGGGTKNCRTAKSGDTAPSAGSSCSCGPRSGGSPGSRSGGSRASRSWASCGSHLGRSDGSQRIVEKRRQA